MTASLADLSHPLAPSAMRGKKRSQTSKKPSGVRATPHKGGTAGQLGALQLAWARNHST